MAGITQLTPPAYPLASPDQHNSTLTLRTLFSIARRRKALNFYTHPLSISLHLLAQIIYFFLRQEMASVLPLTQPLNFFLCKFPHSSKPPISQCIL